MLEFKDYFDLSNYPKDSIYYNNENKKVPGKMKNEYPTRYIHEYSRIYRIETKIIFIIYYLLFENKIKGVHKGQNHYFEYYEYMNTLKHFINHSLKKNNI